MTPILISVLTAGAFLVALFVTRLLEGLHAAAEGGGRSKRRSRHAPTMPHQPGLGALAGALPAWGVVLDQGGALIGGLAVALGIAVLAIAAWWRERIGAPQAVLRLIEILVVGLAVFSLRLLFNQTISALDPSTTAASHTFWYIWPQTYAAVALAGTLWFGFLSAFNHADRAGSVAAADAVLIAAGCAASFWLFSHRVTYEMAFAATLAAGAAGFLAWHRPPAPALMGRIASAPIGFMLGFLLVVLAAMGAWGAALTLPARVGADALLSLMRRRRHQAANDVRSPWHVAMADAALVAAAVVGLVVGGVWGQVLSLILGAVVVGVFVIRAPRTSRPVRPSEAQRATIAPDRRAR